jgi:ATP-dependent DNA helicase RecG
MPKVDLQQLEELIQRPRETPGLEFKEGKNQFSFDKLCDYSVAIANELGGYIVIGVTNDVPRSVVGTHAFPDVEVTRSKILERIGFRVDADAIDHPQGRVVVFSIPSRPQGTPLHHAGCYLMRVDDKLVSMTPDQLRRIIEEGRPDFCAEIALKHQDATQVVELLDTACYYDLLKAPYPSNRDEVVRRFEAERLIVRRENGCFDITNLGALVFAKDLARFDGFDRKAVRVVVYDGPNKLRTRLDRPGRRGLAVGFRSLVEFISTQIPQHEVIENALRRQDRMVPEIVIRELVANAMVHQDLSEQGFSVVVDVYADRLEITNPGVPFIPANRFIDENQSRNDRLADLMRRLGICEEKGSGIDKVVDAVEKAQLPAPDFRVAERHTVAVVRSSEVRCDVSGRSDPCVLSALRSALP